MKRLLSLILAILLAFTFVSCAEPETPKFTVTFEGIEHDSVVVTLGEKFKLPADLPTKDGHVLVVKMGDTVLEAGKEYEITADTVLKCSFEKYKWIITVDGVQTQVIDGYKYEILKSKEEYLATSVKVDDEVFKEESIVITKDTKIDYEWSKAWTLTVDGKTEQVLDGFGYKIDKIRKGYICKSVKVNGVETDLDAVVIDKDTRIEYVWIPAYTITYTGAINGTVAVPRGETYTIPLDIRNSLTSVVPDEHVFVIVVDGVQYFPGDEIEVAGDIFIENDVLPMTQGITYKVQEEFVEITGIDSSGNPDTLVIPEKIEGKPVAIIGASAFESGKFSHVYLSECISLIRDSAFSQNTVTSISLPDSVRHIDEFAFFKVPLTHIRLSDRLDTIGLAAFAGNQLSSIDFPEGLSVIDDEAFSASANLCHVTIPSSVTTMGTLVFSNCPELAYINVAKNKADCASWSSHWQGNANVLYNDSELRSFTVSFKGDGVDIPSMQVEEGSSLVLSADMFTKPGYRLSIMNGTEEMVSGKKYTISGDTELACTWIRQYKLEAENAPATFVDEGTVYEIPLFIEGDKVVNVKVNGQDYTGNSIEIHEDTTITWELVSRQNAVVCICYKEGDTVLQENSENKLEGEVIDIPFLNGYYIESIKDASGAVYQPGTQVKVQGNINLTYSVRKGSADLIIDGDGSVTAYEGTDTEVVIPDVSEQGVLVKSLNTSLFSGNDNIISVVIPNGVERIGRGVFDQCVKLESVILPSGLKTIPNGAFYKCSELKQIELPSKLQQIESSAFSFTSLNSLDIPASVTELNGDMVCGCNNLTTLTVDPENKVYKSVGNNILSLDGKTLVVGTVNKGVIPEGIIHIGDGACSNSGITGLLEVPDSVQTIGADAFSFNKLESVKLSSNVDVIGDRAFLMNRGLREVTLPEGLKKIGSEAFTYTDLKNIVIPGSVEVVEDAFSQCYHLSRITVNKKISECASWNPDWHGAADSYKREVKFNDGIVIFPAATSLTLKSKNETIYLGGGTITLRAEVIPSVLFDTITWTTSDEKVATVDNGVVTPVGKGTAVITAKAGDKTATCTVDVSKADVESVSLNKGTATLTLGGSNLELLATVNPGFADQTVTWTTDNDKVATVEDGVVTAVGKGTATITAKAGDKTAICNVTVQLPSVTSITLDNKSATLILGGDTLTLKATVLPDIADKTITWTTDNDKVATVSNGVVTAVGKGTATITAKAGAKTAICTVEVMIPEAVSVSLDTGEVFLNTYWGMADGLRHEQTVVANVFPEAADQSVTWESSNPELVTVENGLVKAVKYSEGTAEITARTDNGKETRCTVHVGRADFSIEQPWYNSWVGGYTLPFEYTYTVPELKTKTESHLTSSDSSLIKIDEEAKTITTAKVTEESTCTLKLTNEVMGIDNDIEIIVYPSAERIIVDLPVELDYMFSNDARRNRITVKAEPANAIRNFQCEKLGGNNVSFNTNPNNAVISFGLGEANFRIKDKFNPSVKSSDYRFYVSPVGLRENGSIYVTGSGNTAYIPSEVMFQPAGQSTPILIYAKSIDAQSWESISFQIDNFIFVGDFKEFLIDNYAFKASPLKKINIPSNSNVGYMAFAESKNLESVFVGKNVTFDTNVFDGCTALKTIWMEETAPDDNTKPAWAPDGATIVYGKTFDEFWPERWKPSSEQTPSV